MLAACTILSHFHKLFHRRRRYAFYLAKHKTTPWEMQNKRTSKEKSTKC